MNTPKFSSFVKHLHLYALPLAIGFGTIIFFVLRFVPGLEGTASVYGSMVTTVTPYLIFIILYLSFCRVELQQMKPKHWHFYILLFQIAMSVILALWTFTHPDSKWNIEIEGAIACIITPTAAAAAAIGTRLGCSVSGIISFTIMSNLQAAIFIPLLFPLFEGRLSGSFMEIFLIIALKVFPLIVLPLILGFITRYTLKRLHTFIVVKLKDIGFYLWAFTLMSLTGVAWSNILDSAVDSATLIFLILIGFFTTVLQFGAGRFFGHFEGQKFTAGQCLGQKNMVFGIWCASSFLNPAAAIAPGCYIFSQNIVNAFQLWYKERLDAKRILKGLKPYHE